MVEVGKENSGTNLLFGGLNGYPQYAEAKIRDVFGSSSGNERGRAERQTLWNNHKRLLESANESGTADILETTFNYIKSLSTFTRDQLENCPPGGLGMHLKEVTSFSHSLLLDGARSRIPNVISDHNALLLAEVVAPMHDIMKFLGSPGAQVMPDHEVITSAYIRKTFVGRKITLKGEAYTLTQTDVDFVAGVVGDHENIEKEEGRRGYISSDSEIDRAKALFFVVDVLTGAIITKNNDFMIDLGQLRTRFTDLYFRHIDLDKGKIFRPQWGAYAIGDILATLRVLGENGLIIQSPDNRTVPQILIGSAVEAIDKALAVEPTNSKRFNDEQRTAILEAKRSLSEMINLTLDKP